MCRADAKSEGGCEIMTLNGSTNTISLAFPFNTLGFSLILLTSLLLPFSARTCLLITVNEGENRCELLCSNKVFLYQLTPLLLLTHSILLYVAKP